MDWGWVFGEPSLPSKGSAVETVVPNLIRSSAQVFRLLPWAGEGEGGNTTVHVVCFTQLTHKYTHLSHYVLHSHTSLSPHTYTYTLAHHLQSWKAPLVTRLTCEHGSCPLKDSRVKREAKNTQRLCHKTSCFIVYYASLDQYRIQYSHTCVCACTCIYVCMSITCVHMDMYIILVYQP